MKIRNQKFALRKRLIMERNRLSYFFIQAGIVSKTIGEVCTLCKIITKQGSVAIYRQIDGASATLPGELFAGTLLSYDRRV